MKLIYVVEKVIEFSFYALFFITPIVFNPSRTLPSFELFEWNKLMFVYAMTSIITTAWIIRMFLYGKFIYSRTYLDVPLLLFFASQILSTIFSIDPHVSIFGYYSRFHGGLLSTISYIILYWAFVSNRELIKWHRLLGVILISGTGVAMYGILEKFGIDAGMWVQDVQNRVFSTLGQPNWLAAYLTILLPISIVQLIKLNPSLPPLNLRGGKVGLLGKRINGIYWIAVLLFYLCLLFTKSRSGFLGFWAGNMVLWGGIFYLSNGVRNFHRSYTKSTTSNNNQFPTHLFIILNSSFLVLNFLIKTPFSQYNRLFTQDIFSKTSFVEEKPPVGDSVINVGVTDSADIRRIVWKGAIDIAKVYPIFGTGPETFAYSYYKFRSAEHNLTSEWDFLYNRAHNEFLNILATTGLVGFISYLLIILTFLIWIVKSLLRTMNYELRTMNLALLSAYLSILITNFFGFSVVVVGLYFYLIPAVIWSLIHKKSSPVLPQSITSTQIILSTGSVVVLLVVFAFLLRFWIADSLYARGLSYSRQEEYAMSYPYLKEAIILRGDEPNYRDELSLVGSNLSLSLLENGEATRASELIHEAVDASNFALRTSPQNINFWKTRTKMYFALSVLDESFVQSALDSILIARELAPTDPKIAYNAAVIYGHAGKNKEAIEVLIKTIDLKPDYRDAYIALSIFYEEEKQTDNAREILELALKRINPEDKEIIERLGKIR